jgi:Flp pilus assembly protein TadG
MRRVISHRKTDTRRRGAAAVEMAVSAPVLVILLLGILDLGQFVNMGEVMSNTCRITARKAARSFTVTNQAVKDAAVDHLDNHFPQVSRQVLADATTVTVKNGAGSVLTDAALKDVVRSGDRLVVTVTFDYSQIRWLGKGLPYLNNSDLSFTTTIRRI